MVYQYQNKDTKYGNTSKNYLENHLANYNLVNINSYSKNNTQDIQANSVVETIFTDRTRSLKSTVNELLAEIECRENLHADLKSKIGDDLYRCGEYLQEVKFFTNSPYNLDTNFTSRKTGLESQMLSLEEQKRTEDLTCWRDLMFLKKYLMFALKDYWKLSKSKAMLEGR